MSYSQLLDTWQAKYWRLFARVLTKQSTQDFREPSCMYGHPNCSVEHITHHWKYIMLAASVIWAASLPLFCNARALQCLRALGLPGCDADHVVLYSGGILIV